jgi:hypothetical protein
MKKLLDMLLIPILLLVAFCSCVDSEYDLNNIDDSGGLSPALTLPIGTLNTGIIDFLKGAGIEDQLQIGTDTIYVIYKGSMPLNLVSHIDFGNTNIIYNIPANIRFSFDEVTSSIDIDIFKNLASKGNVLNLFNPQIHCTMHNYIGADITVNINSITSEGNGEQRQAEFSNGRNIINIGSAPATNEYTAKKEIFDRANGNIHKLFENSPERISYDFSVDLTVPNDGNPHFIVKDKYMDVEYEVRIPLTFGSGTMLANADTLDFDLSGEGFINNIDNLKLWVDYANSLRATVDLDILFLDEYKREIPSITKHFQMAAAPASGRAIQRELPISSIPPVTGTFKLSFNSNEFDDAQKAQYVVLKSILKTGNNESVNIHPADYINLKLSAYSKVNI